MSDDCREATARRCLPPAEWPERDRAAWAAAHRRGGLLDEDGLAASWAPATSALIAGSYGRYLAFLTENGVLDPGASPDARITRARIEDYVADLRRHNHSSTVAARILQLVRAVAVMCPAADLAPIRRILSRLRRMATPARDDRGRMVPVATLFNLANELMERAETAPGLPNRTRSLLYRNGLMIAVLCACPLRAGNLSAMSIGKSLQRRGDTIWIVFGRDETKNRRPIELPLPDRFAVWITRYLEHYRPQLLGAATGAEDAFWLSYRGKRLTTKKVGQTVNIVTARELGRAVNPHLFRKLVATELAIRDPAHVGIAQPLLGHATYTTTERAYNLSRSLDAAGRHQAVVQSIRAGSRAAPRVNRAGTGRRSTDQAQGAIRVSRLSARRDAP